MLKQVTLLVLALCVTQQAFAVSPEHKAGFKKNFFESCVSGAPAKMDKEMLGRFQGYCGCAADAAANQLTDQQVQQIGLTGKTGPVLDKIINTCLEKYRK